MHGDIKDAFRAAIQKAGAELEPLVDRYKEPHLVWSRQEQGGWRGQYQERPSLTAIFLARSLPALDEAASQFTGVLHRYHPEYGGMVGFKGIGTTNLGLDPSYILRQAMLTLW